MPHIFISYSTKDLEQMLEIYTILRLQGLDVWVDKFQIQAGAEAWSQAIEEGIKTSQCFLLLLSPDSNQSRWVQAEIRRAQMRKKPIQALFLRGDELESLPFGFEHFQYIDVRVGQYSVLLELRLFPVLEHTLNLKLPLENAPTAEQIKRETDQIRRIEKIYRNRETAEKGFSEENIPVPPHIPPPPLPGLMERIRRIFVGILMRIKLLHPTIRRIFVRTSILSLISVILALGIFYIAPPIIAHFTRTLTPQESLQATVTALTVTQPIHNTDWTPYFHTFDGIEMALVPSGCFKMGSLNGEADEKPVEQVCFEEPFWIARYEVTNGKFDELGGHAQITTFWEGQNQPRTNVTWYEALAFCESRDERLPTEAEWEYAAAGPESRLFPWGNVFSPDKVVYLSNSGERTRDVGTIPAGASWVGALDMSGNVREWTSSLYRDYPYDALDGREAPDVFDSRVARGGAWSQDDPTYLRTANRYTGQPDQAYTDFGFRCARNL